MNILSTTRRRIIPRWRNFATTAAMGELGSLSAKRCAFEPEVPDVQKRKEDWARNKTLWTAGDLLAAALHAHDWDAVVDASLFLINSGVSVPPITMELARAAVQWSHTRTPFSKPTEVLSKAVSFEASIVSRLRLQLREFPINPIHWMELALAYAVIGKDKSAERAVLVALQLAPNDRFILRSACRFFLHSQQPDRAVRILSKSERTPHDPWLIAAHLAASEVAGKTSFLAKVGRTFISNENLAPFHVTELGAALGNLELLDGNDRRATKFFRKALDSPTENSLAQIWWAKRRLLVEYSDLFQKLPRAYEASARASMATGKFEAALPFSEQWRNDEPFSARPCVTSVFLHQLQEEHSKAVEIAKLGLQSNPEHPVLVNGLAYSLAMLGKTVEANQIIGSVAQASLPEEQKVIFTATEGLIRYRQGDAQAGRLLYEAAVEDAKKLSPHLHPLALLYFVREEARVDIANAVKILHEAGIDWKQCIESSQHVSTMASKVTRALSESSALTNGADDTSRLDAVKRMLDEMNQATQTLKAPDPRS